MTQQLKHLTLVCIFFLASAVEPSSSSFAQQTLNVEPPLPQRNAKYMSDVHALARLLGRAHAIRVTCNGRSDQFWRVYMQEMLNMEAPEQGHLRQSLARAFNDAYTSEATVRNWCNEAAVQAEAVYAAEGRTLSDTLAQHYFKRSN